MVLLSEDAMKGVFGGACYSTVCDDCTHGCRFIAKAQLKKMVGELERLVWVAGDVSAGFRGSSSRFADWWQALLKEVDVV